ncbi:MAG TPA: aldehyde dehydrogenase family protein, partial [Sphingomicrobium sp.]|nr:aldehyde dehydrogenase family protein [Sphingomicrobium sp.]
MSRTALLLVDVQEDYLARPNLQPPRAELIANIAAALANARAMGEPIFHVRTGGSIPMPHRTAVPDATPPPELIEHAGEPVFTKRFFSAFDAPGLADALDAGGITRLRLAGLHAHACIHATALDAYARGFEVEIDENLVGSDNPAFAAQSLRWLDGRAANIITSQADVWLHRDPCEQDRIIAEVPLMDIKKIKHLTPADDPVEKLTAWYETLSSTRQKWVETLIATIAKPRADAEAEVTYGLALLANVIATLNEQKSHDARKVTYRPVGRAGLITPWNNPFAIPIGKIAPAIGFGNTVVWKPALPGTPIADMLNDSLADVGLADSLALITGGAATGRAMVEQGDLDLLSFTGSVPTGRAIIAAAGHRALAVQAELGGCNAAIVDSSADLDFAATDLAAAMF